MLLITRVTDRQKDFIALKAHHKKKKNMFRTEQPFVANGNSNTEQET